MRSIDTELLLRGGIAVGQRCSDDGARDLRRLTCSTGTPIVHPKTKPLWRGPGTVNLPILSPSFLLGLDVIGKSMPASG